MAYLLHEQTLQLPPAITQSLPVGGIDNPDDRVRLLKVVLPVGPEGLLPTDVPYT